MAKAEAESLLFQISELIRGVEARNRQVITRRAQILSDSENIDAAIGEVAENVDQFGHGFAEADHQAGLRHHPWRKLLGVFEQPQRALIARTRADHTVQPRN